MATEIISKNELQSLSGKLNDLVNILKSDFDNMKGTLTSVADYDGINVSGAANILKTNLDNIINDLDIANSNIKSYIELIIELDVDDFSDEDINDKSQIVVSLSNDSNIENKHSDDFNTTGAIITGVVPLTTSTSKSSSSSSSSSNRYYGSSNNFSSANALDSVVDKLSLIHI